MTREEIISEFREVTGINEAKKIYKKLSKCITKIVFFIYSAIMNLLAYL